MERYEEAHKIIQRLHHDPEDPEDPTNPLAEAEFIQIMRQVQFDKQEEAGYIQVISV